MEKLKNFFECLIPISNCNLKCSYCYVIQEKRRDTLTNGFVVPPETIGNAFRKERVGGTSLINLCGFGETLIPPEMPQIIYALLKQGHFVNVTSNGTLTQRFKEIVEICPPAYLQRLSFSFSLHYIELKERGFLDSFIENVHLVKKAGASILIQLNMADEYIACIDEIQAMCKKEFGALPQVALTRRELFPGYEIMTEGGEERYMEAAKRFNSLLFEFTFRNFNVKRKEFCYAGEWSFKVNLGTGDIRSCYCRNPHQNLYADLDAPVKRLPVGNHCTSCYCINSSHFMSLGIIPYIDCPSYVELRDRTEAGWYQPQMKAFLSQKLGDNNRRFGPAKRLAVNIRQRKILLLAKAKGIVARLMKQPC